MGGPVGPTYTTSTATNVATGTVLWITITPEGFSATWPHSATSATLRVYAQSTKPVATDTPLVTETLTGSAFQSLSLFTRGGDSVIADIELTSEDLHTFNPSVTPATVKEVPILTSEGVFASPNLQDTVTQGTLYLGTDKIYERTETD